MSTNYFPKKTLKLHSPLLSGTYKNKNENENKKKSKITYFDPSTEGNETVDQTLDTTIFQKSKISKVNSPLKVENKNSYNLNKINNLEIIFKIASTFITAIGGTFCLLQLIEIVRALQNEMYSIGHNLFLLLSALIVTIVANIICAGFTHLVKTTKYIFLSTENNNAKLSKLLNTTAK